MAPEETPTGNTSSEQSQTNGAVNVGSEKSDSTTAESKASETKASDTKAPETKAQESISKKEDASSSQIPPTSTTASPETPKSDTAAGAASSDASSTIGSMTGAAGGPVCDMQSCCKNSILQSIEWSKKVFADPVGVWKEVKEKSWTISDMYTGYLIPLSVMSIVASYIAFNILGPLPIISISGIFRTLISFAMSMGAFYAMALLIKALATQFGGTTTLENCMKLVLITFLPVMLGSLALIIPIRFVPFVGLLLLIALGVGVYAFYHGIPEMTGTDPSKRLPIFITTVVGTMFFMMVIQQIM